MNLHSAHVYLCRGQVLLLLSFPKPESCLFQSFLFPKRNINCAVLLIHTNHCEAPPRRARTRCNVAPPSRLYSAAVLSSALYHYPLASAAVPNFMSSTNVSGLVSSVILHLLSAEDQTLLNGRNTLLLLNALLYPGDLGELK